ncbi:c-type cytochrome [Pseudomonas entomophila]|uniref:c-type cytochrome n=1 Tax=Pseudomonas entomophila TaxID=312306 RepID=UPI0023D86EB6|nr:c-type cytochrome [Pseudomonas entomophila]MDF0732725.1 c-type cytochrome [Pseudomonas entomophila]
MVRVTVIAAALGLFGSTQAWAEDVQSIMQRYACSACHQPAARTVGPSWQEIATRYRDGSKTAEQLVQSVKKGSTGQWGPVPMPPQPQANDADLLAITQWILSQP